jgi:hypothetical protein
MATVVTGSLEKFRERYCSNIAVSSYHIFVGRKLDERKGK